MAECRLFRMGASWLCWLSESCKLSWQCRLSNPALFGMGEGRGCSRKTMIPLPRKTPNLTFLVYSASLPLDTTRLDQTNCGFVIDIILYGEKRAFRSYGNFTHLSVLLCIFLFIRHHLLFAGQFLRLKLILCSGNSFARI